MEEKKTRIEWAKQYMSPLEFVRFVTNTCALSEEILFFNSPDFRHAIFGAFAFSNSKEGNTYWFDLVNRIEKEHNL